MNEWHPTVVTLGETMALLRTTEIGSLRHAPCLRVGVGGAESNVAIGLSRLGIAASWLGRVGDDPLGERVTREIRAEGVHVRAIVDQDASTGLMIKERPTPSTTAVHYRRAGSAGSCLSPEDIPDGWIESASLLHLTGITALISETALATADAAIDRASSAGVHVSFDINHRTALAESEHAAAVLLRLAERASIVFGGSDELTLLRAGSDVIATAESLLGYGCGEVVIKLGSQGALVVKTDGIIEGPAYPVDPVDTVGAGDSFVAGYLSAWLSGLSPAATLRRANACGAIACLNPGDWEAAPNLSDIRNFQNHGADPVRR